jgi:hypothetical protein
VHEYRAIHINRVFVVVAGPRQPFTSWSANPTYRVAAEVCNLEMDAYTIHRGQDGRWFDGNGYALVRPVIDLRPAIPGPWLLGRDSV